VKRLAILASGRGSNALALIRACQSGQVPAQVALVMSDRPQAGVLALAAEMGVPSALVAATDYPDKGSHERALAAQLQAYQIDVLALAGYRRLLTPFLVGFLYDPQLGQSRILNIHPADTRQFQGLGGYAWALSQGLQQTAVTVHYVDEGMDTGKILLQRPLEIGPAESLESLEQRGLHLEHQMYPQALQVFIEQWEAVCAAS
jgi:phosphoribosylglycinamide formyltransferase-1